MNFFRSTSPYINLSSSRTERNEREVNYRIIKIRTSRMQIFVSILISIESLVLISSSIIRICLLVILFDFVNLSTKKKINGFKSLKPDLKKPTKLFNSQPILGMKWFINYSHSKIVYLTFDSLLFPWVTISFTMELHPHFYL